MSWHKETLIGFDIETTGLDLDRDQIISAAVVLVGENREKETKEWLIKPSIPVPQEAIDLHGISVADIEKGMDPALGVAEIINFIHQSMISGGSLVVFNAPFDLTILNRQARDLELETLEDITNKEDYIVIDPLVIDRVANPNRMGRRNLQTLCRHYGIPFNFNNAHSAETDAVAAARLAWKMGEVYKALDGIDRVELFERQKIWAERQRLEIEARIKKPAMRGWPLREKESEQLVSS